jgi:hypothetical protein
LETPDLADARRSERSALKTHKISMAGPLKMDAAGRLTELEMQQACQILSF